MVPMKSGSFALVSLLCWVAPFAHGQSPSAESSGGQFVKPTASVNFKEAMSFAEISLMVRMGVSEAEITQEISQRGLVRPILATESSSLQAKGAGPALLATLRDPRYVLTQEELQKYEQRQAAKQNGGNGEIITRSFSNAPAPAPANNNTQASKEAREIEIPLEQFTTISVNGRPLRIAVHDNGDGTISVRLRSERPARFTKTEGFDSRHDNLTFLTSNEGGKVYYVNTSRAHMNMCILRTEPN